MILVRKTLQVKMENRVSGFGYKAEELGHSQMSIIIKREREKEHRISLEHYKEMKYFNYGCSRRKRTSHQKHRKHFE